MIGTLVEGMANPKVQMKVGSSHYADFLHWVQSAPAGSALATP